MDQRILSFINPYLRVRNITMEIFTMATATLTSKGQITIPIQVRTALGLETEIGRASCRERVYVLV